MTAKGLRQPADSKNILKRIVLKRFVRQVKITRLPACARSLVDFGFLNRASGEYP